MSVTWKVGGTSDKTEADLPKLGREDPRQEREERLAALADTETIDRNRQV